MVVGEEVVAPDVSSVVAGFLLMMVDIRDGGECGGVGDGMVGDGLVADVWLRGELCLQVFVWWLW